MGETALDEQIFEEYRGDEGAQYCRRGTFSPAKALAALTHLISSPSSPVSSLG
jgi:hypothetical protein